jgi:hypothetical protein
MTKVASRMPFLSPETQQVASSRILPSLSLQIECQRVDFYAHSDQSNKQTSPRQGNKHSKPGNRQRQAHLFVQYTPKLGDGMLAALPGPALKVRLAVHAAASPHRQRRASPWLLHACMDMQRRADVV